MICTRSSTQGITMKDYEISTRTDILVASVFFLVSCLLLGLFFLPSFKQVVSTPVSGENR